MGFCICCYLVQFAMNLHQEFALLVLLIPRIISLNFPPGFEVLRISLENPQVVQELHDLLELNSVRILDNSPDFVDIAVHSDAFHGNTDEITKFVSNAGLPYKINTFLKSLAHKYSNIVQIFSGGFSFEGRQLLGVRIGANSNRPSIWIDAGATARNWLGPASAVFIASQLAQKYSTDSSLAALVQNFNFFILPVTNPDGYDYTWTTDRTWVKTRSNLNCTFWSCCYGVNMNRNWNFHWGGTGSSGNPCTSTYHGQNAFSEPETLQISNLLQSLKSGISAYFSFDGCGEMLQYPYGYARNQFPTNYPALVHVGAGAIKAIRSVHNMPYRLGNAADTSLYLTDGLPTDWVKGVLGVNYTYTIQSRPSSGPSCTQYVINTKQIIPSAEETFQGIKAVANQISSAGPK